MTMPKKIGIDLARRNWLKNTGGVLISLPLIFISRQAGAKINAAQRSEFKYQQMPKEDMSCITCLEFLPGKTDKDLGGCKLLPGDDEVSPAGYCIRWNTM